MYHVIGRGIERCKVFIEQDDYRDFLSRLKVASEKTGGKCLAWCLMPNHFHLLILRGERHLAELMRTLMSGYATNYNIRHGRAGHLFQNRYKSILCEEERYLRELVAYIHLNPVRAGIIKNVNELARYKWCGHSALIKNEPDGIINVDYVLAHFGADSNTAARKYKKFLMERVGKCTKGKYSGGGLVKSMGGFSGALRFCSNKIKEISDERILGEGDFVERILKRTGEQYEKYMSHRCILKKVEKLTGLKGKDIFSHSRRRRIVQGRAVYCFLKNEKGGVKGAELMKELALSCGAISALIHKGRDILEGTRGKLNN